MRKSNGKVLDGMNKLLMGSFVASDGTQQHYFREVSNEEITEIQKEDIRMHHGWLPKWRDN